MSELLVNLLALNKGLKPCILWDYIVASPSQLSRLASQACVGVPGVMDLGGDFVMYDRSVIRDHLQDFVVNLTASHGPLPQTFITRCKTLSQQSSSKFYGLLLGFHVVYWFNQTESFDNCLSGCHDEVPGEDRNYRLVGDGDVAGKVAGASC